MRVIPADKVRMIMKAAIEAAARSNDANVVIILMIQAFKDMVEHERPV